jgi:hypothetical protein
MPINKTELFEACMQQQNKEVENFENRVSSLKKDLFENTESASQSAGGNADRMELLANYEKELVFSQMEMNQLSSLNPSVANIIVEPGAVVMTDQLNFYISIPTDKIEINGESFIGISIKSPIYSVMQGKKKGDSFEFNERAYNILDLF